MTRPTTAIYNPDEEDLVAYLDGELTGLEIQRIEERLSADDDYRRQLQQLQRAWDLLDDLPRREASESFSQSTVSMVALQTSGEFPVTKSRSGRWLGTAASILLAGVAGYWATYLIYDSPNRELLADLPIIERLDVYQSADSLDFIRLLAEEGLFDEEMSNGP